MDFSGCPNDQSIGPAVEGCRDNFDFTIKFEQVFFSILPASICVALCLPRTAYLSGRRAIVGGVLLQSTKLVSIGIYSALQLSLLILSTVREGRFEIFFVSSSALTFLATLCMAVVSHLEHTRSPRPSFVLTTYLSISILLDAAQTRTLWLASTTSYEKIFTQIFTTAVAVKLLVTVLEVQQKAKWIRWDAKEYSPEETSGLFDLGAFVWLNRLFLTGYQKTLALNDLFSLGQSMASEPLQANLSHYFSQVPRTGQRHSLARAVAKSLAIPLLLPIGPRLAMTALQFCQPFLIHSLLDYLQLQKPHEESTKNIGYGLIGATFLVHVGIAFSGAYYCFGWQVGKHSISNINIEIPASQLTMVVGPVASGKSTLCKALIGEAPFALGQVYIGASSLKIGYCDQTPYLSNSTIRENIVGFAPFQRARYDEILDATILRPDLASLPLSDETKVGSNGITLSGGQKQRVALARALYLDSNLLIFDDVLSGLDADTAEHIFCNFFSAEGLLPRRKVTVVLCTHAVRRLPLANHIIALRSDGSLEEQGTFSDLLANKGYVHSLGVEEIEAFPEKEDIKHAKPTVPVRPKSSLKVTGPLSPNFGDERKRMTGEISVYRHYFSRLDTISLVLFIVFGVGWGFFSNFTTIWLKYWSEDVTSTHPEHSRTFYIGLYVLFQVSTLACILCICLVCFKSLIQVSGARLHKEALSTVVNAPLNFFTTTDTGVVTNLFSQDMNLIDGELPLALINVNNRLFTSLGMAAVVATSSAYLIITFPILAAVLYGIQKFYLRTSRQIRLLDLEAKSPLYAQFIDTIKGVATIRAFGWVKEVVALNDKLLDDSQRPAYLLAMIQRWLQFILQLVVAGLATVVVALATQLRSNSAFAGASLVTLMTFGNTLSFLIRVFTVAETSMGAVSRLKTFSESVKSENLTGENIVPLLKWPSRGNVEIRGMSAAYEEVQDRNSGSACDGDSQKETSQHLALVDINLSIAPGEKVAICGRTGSGKSSVILLLLRFLDPLSSCDGDIMIDDTPLHRIDRSMLRQCIIAVPQDPVFLPDGTSFQVNLDPHGQSTEAECSAVLELVGLRDAVDDGLTSAMASDALSQGQKQLFSLARAVLRRRVRSRARELGLGEKSMSGDGGILLLDEFSSGVDQETEKVMQKIIHMEFEAYTVVMVSHRLDMVINFDIVVIMDGGSIVEKGKPRDLIHAEGSRFGDLWNVENKR